MDGTTPWLALGLLVLFPLFLYGVLRQQGRILLRLDALERRLAGLEAAGGAEDELAGLEPGTEVPPFRLTTADDGEAGLQDFRGRRLLLVHWSVDCGYCDLIAADLAALDDALRARRVALLLLSYGGAGENRAFAREHGLACPILLQKEPLAIFDGLGTPVAYLVDEDGRVAKPLAVGVEEVLTLVRDAAGGRRRLASERSLGESAIEREGLAAGTPAPAFTLPEVRGGTLSLDDYRGRRVLLVFSDPDCGPCDALAPKLALLHERHGDTDLALVMVGRGDAATNGRKAEEHAIRFPVVVQERWKLSKAYGIFATPVAFLVDEQGVIAREVAVGRESILALAHEALGGS